MDVRDAIELLRCARHRKTHRVRRILRRHGCPLAFATRHPTHPGKLILVSTEAAGTSHPERRVAQFERLGGPEVGALARRRFIEGKLDAADMEAWERLTFPVYTRRPKDSLAAQRGIRRGQPLVRPPRWQSLSRCKPTTSETRGLTRRSLPKTGEKVCPKVLRWQ
jgi:hypothetical protein